jgi:hypothetical protein
MINVKEFEPASAAFGTNEVIEGAGGTWAWSASVPNNNGSRIILMCFLSSSPSFPFVLKPVVSQ